ncbi:hypothetical protein E2C01_052016 [Portunus trituberculatus]|uniref:Uncharacterized protein n=1 Tax=Portunus trituberculatus TaxID=210409 RepID=A0A5B7GNA2_PORTR|nr:hypothetical protein [Portunus trituberculatus]
MQQLCSCDSCDCYLCLLAMLALCNMCDTKRQLRHMPLVRQGGCRNRCDSRGRCDSCDFYHM